METIAVSKNDLKALLEWFEYFIEEDDRSCDQCKFCGMRYGNASLMIKRGQKLTHYQSCEYLIAQDMGTRL